LPLKTKVSLPANLPKWIDARQTSGLYFFTRKEAIRTLKLSDAAFKMAASRLQKKGRIQRILGGFYIIIPLEYSSTQVLPADWFIADLMNHIGQPYYVGLLTAAAIQGAAHQQPLEFQVVTPRSLRSIRAKNLAIHFFHKTHFAATPTNTVKVQTGFMHISTPEATAIDLIRYARAIGGVDRVYTVLQELAEILKPAGLLEAIGADGKIAFAQRLGFLLEKAGYASTKLEPLYQWVKKRKAMPTLLDPSLSAQRAKEKNRWNVLINTVLESEL